jgi:hypothetical protein
MGAQSAPDAIARHHGSGLQAVATRGFMASYQSGCLLAAVSGSQRCRDRRDHYSSVCGALKHRLLD